MEINLPSGFILALALSFPAWATPPAPSLTTDAIAPNTTQQNILSTVCIKGYTQIERPPAYYSNDLKKRPMREYVCTHMNPNNFNGNYLIPTNVAGIPDNQHNPWSEPRINEVSADKKSHPEFVLYKLVCSQKAVLCGSTVHDADKMALGVQEVCAWKSLSSWTLIWSCRLK